MSGFTRAKSIEKFVENNLKTGMINSIVVKKSTLLVIYVSSDASFSRCNKLVSRLLKHIIAEATLDSQVPQR